MCTIPWLVSFVMHHYHTTLTINLGRGGWEAYKEIKEIREIREIKEIKDIRDVKDIKAFP